MEKLEVTPENTVFFGQEYEYLLLTLIKFEYMLYRYKDTIYYKHQIWSDKDGWWLTFQTYDVITHQPCKAR